MADDRKPTRGLSAHLHVSLRALARGDAEIIHLISRITGEEPEMEVVELDDAGTPHDQPVRDQDEGLPPDGETMAPR